VHNDYSQENNERYQQAREAQPIRRGNKKKHVLWRFASGQTQHANMVERNEERQRQHKYQITPSPSSIMLSCKCRSSQTSRKISVFSFFCLQLLDIHLLLALVLARNLLGTSPIFSPFPFPIQPPQPPNLLSSCAASTPLNSSISLYLPCRKYVQARLWRLKRRSHLLLALLCVSLHRV